MKGWQQNKFLRHFRKKHIRTWQLILVFLLCAAVSVFFLRQNNLKMIELRSAVVQADRDNGDVAGALTALNQHVFDHMNTQIVRPVELVQTYTNETKVIIEAANNTSGRDIYAEATAACERRGIPLASIAQCTADYAINNNPGVDPKELQLPDKSLFTHTFASPLWTPDGAGIFLVLTGVVFIWIILRLFEYILVRLIVRKRLNNTF